MTIRTAPEAAPVPVKFQQLWNNYPHSAPCVNQKTGEKAYDNQCAIRVGMALEKSGVSFKSFVGPRCAFGPHGNGMVLRAKALAIWLYSMPFKSCPASQVYEEKGFHKRLAGRTGIVFFQDYWARSTDKANSPTGDHIDLWNRDRLTPSMETFMRFTLGISRVPNLNPFGSGNIYSDLEKSRQVMFWAFP